MEAWRKELYHHGIKGMRWGVRRFQNYDGSYTKKGLDRYRESEEQYNKAHENLRNLKAARKSGQQVSSHDIKAAKRDVKLAKSKMSDRYDQLQRDYDADEGKKLYSQGKTITNNYRTAMKRLLGVILASTVTRIVTDRLTDSGTVYIESMGDVPISKISGDVVSAVGGLITGQMLNKEQKENRQLRAYYAH